MELRGKLRHCTKDRPATIVEDFITGEIRPCRCGRRFEIGGLTYIHGRAEEMRLREVMASADEMNRRFGFPIRVDPDMPPDMFRIEP